MVKEAAWIDVTLQWTNTLENRQISQNVWLNLNDTFLPLLTFRTFIRLTSVSGVSLEDLYLLCFTTQQELKLKATIHAETWRPQPGVSAVCQDWLEGTSPITPSFVLLLAGEPISMWAQPFRRSDETHSTQSRPGAQLAPSDNDYQVVSTQNRDTETVSLSQFLYIFQKSWDPE